MLPRLVNEFALIDTFLSEFDVRPPPAGPGDDCAVIPPGRHATCVTTDALVDGVHFTRDTFSLEDVGHKALAVNLSDLAAMGAEPDWAVCALGLPRHVTPDDVRELGRGMSRLARAHGVRLVGGNVTRALELSVTLTVSGKLPRGRAPLLRSGTKPGDVLYVSGPLGLAAAGLDVLSRARTAGGHVPESFSALARAQRRPAPHLAWALAAAPLVSAAIDVSDGLAQDLGHVCESSRVGAELTRASLPITAELEAWAGSRERAESTALTGGEDYVLLVAVAEKRVRAFEQRLERHGFTAFRVGLVTKGEQVTVDGAPLAGKTGFQHFR